MKVKLEDVCERGSSNLKQSDIVYDSGNYPIYGASGYIGNVDFYHQDKPYVAVVKDGAGIGRTTLHPAKSSVIGTMQYLIPKKNVLPEYLYYVVRYMHLEKYFTGATIPHIYFKDYKNEQFNLDSLEKQKKIIDILGKCESVINTREKELQKLDRLIRARFFELFGDLVEGDKIKDNRRKIGDIASVTKLAGFEFTKYIKYKDIGSIGDSDVIMLRGLNCKGGRLVLDDIKWIDRETSDLLPRSKLYVGDILITYAGTIGDIALVDEDNKYHLAPNVGKISIIDKLSYDPVFLVHLLMYSNKYIMSFASKVAQASINMQKIRNFEYYFPSFEEQKHFSTFVEQVNKSKVEVQKALDEAQLLFDSLMQKYFG